jgi:hypothetical protein
MTTHYDHKGKYFTEVISKDVVHATIQTLTVHIRGCIHVRPGERFKDELNNSDQFIAVTDASVFNARGDQLYRTDFLAVNRDLIIWVGPEDEEYGQEDEG